MNQTRKSNHIIMKLSSAKLFSRESFWHFNKPQRCCFECIHGVFKRSLDFVCYVMFSLIFFEFCFTKIFIGKKILPSTEPSSPPIPFYICPPEKKTFNDTNHLRLNWCFVLQLTQCIIWCYTYCAGMGPFAA